MAVSVPPLAIGEGTDRGAALRLAGVTLARTVLRTYASLLFSRSTASGRCCSSPRRRRLGPSPWASPRCCSPSPWAARCASRPRPSRAARSRSTRCSWASRSRPSRARPRGLRRRRDPLGAAHRGARLAAHRGPRAPLALALYNLGRFDRAQEAYERVLAQYPGDLEMRTGVGWCELQRGHRAAAATAFRAVLAVSPDDAGAAAGLTAANGTATASR